MIIQNWFDKGDDTWGPAVSLSMLPRQRGLGLDPINGVRVGVAGKNLVITTITRVRTLIVSPMGAAT